MKKFIIVTSLAILTMPVLSFAQSSSSCGMPVNPATAADWMNTISCLQSRISNLESRISALESRAIPGGQTVPTGSGQTVPIPGYGGGMMVPSTPIGVPAAPTTSSSGGTTNTCGATTNPCPIQQGATNEAVKAVQNFLKAEGSFNYPQATGYFGSVTKNAILNFQATQGLTQTGVVDQATLGKIQTLAPQIAPSVVPMLQQIQTSQVKAR